MSLERFPVLQTWPEAGPLLAKALCGSSSTPEDLRRACLRGEAWLVGSERMFLVLRQQGSDLVVWAAAARDGGQACIETHLPDLDQIAAATRTELACVTSRNGFQRRGWKVRAYIMERAHGNF